MPKTSAHKNKGSVKQLLQKRSGQTSAFELASVSKKRHKVLGDRDRGGKARSQTQARARADQIRRETLLVEHQQKGRTNAFIDGRFGENDEGMPLEDKLIHRFQRERQRQLKSSRNAKYALGEEGDGAMGGYDGSALGAPTQLTHGGISLGDMEDLSDADLGDSDEEAGGGKRGGRDRDGFEGADFVKRAHFGGGEDDENAAGERRLTQKELLEETIAKYKLAKYERQEKKAEDNREISALDDEFDEIRGLVFQAGRESAAKAKAAAKAAKSEDQSVAAHLAREGKMSSLAAKRAKGAKGEGEDAASGHADFEKLAAQLSMEMKAQPTERLQTESELATAEAQRLRMMEAERLRRMQPEPAPGGGGGGGGTRANTRGPTDDDLLDDFGPLPGDLPTDELDGGSAPRMKMVKQGGGKNAPDDAKAAVVVANGSGGGDGSELPELPYVYTCPVSAKGLRELMGDVAGPYAARQRELLHRLIAGHHTRLKEANREKLSTLAGLLLDRLMALATAKGTVPLMQPLTPSLFTIAQQLPVQVALVVLEKLQAVRNSWRAEVQQSGSGHVSLPPATLALVALCCQLYSLSDFRHVVLTPLVIFVEEALAQRQPPKAPTDLKRALFLCSCATHLVAGGGRWMPELHAAAHNLFGQLVERGVEPEEVEDAAGRALTFDSLLGEEEEAEAEEDEEQADGKGKAPLAGDIAAAVLRLLTDLAAITRPLPAFIELYSPTLRLVTSPDAVAALPTPVQPLREACAEAIREALRESIKGRAPLQMQRAKVVPIKQFNPAFDDDFQPDISMDPDRERAERQKLRRKTKKETKGAMRELRKDNAFLATERDKEKRKRDEYLEARGKRAMMIMEQQEHSVKEMKKERRKLG